MNSLDELLEEVTVMPCSDMVDNFVEGEPLHNLNSILDGWYAVDTPIGIIAYFGNEVEAFRFRLDIINRILN